MIDLEYHVSVLVACNSRVNRPISHKHSVVRSYLCRKIRAVTPKFQCISRISDMVITSAGIINI